MIPCLSEDDTLLKDNLTDDSFLFPLITKPDNMYGQLIIYSLSDINERTRISKYPVIVCVCFRFIYV